MIESVDCHLNSKGANLCQLIHVSVEKVQNKKKMLIA